jgi:hypothetical protein
MLVSLYFRALVASQRESKPKLGRSAGSACNHLGACGLGALGSAAV